MSFDDPADVRYHPDDGCPLFSERLESHLVAVTRGEAPNRGVFCGNCYTPIGRGTTTCPHCGNDTASGRAAVQQVPDEVVDILRDQRKIEARWVNGMAYIGLLIAVVGGIALVLTIPFFRHSLIWATVLYALILLIGGRSLAGFLGGYFGDRIGFERARARTVAAWKAWVEERG